MTKFLVTGGAGFIGSHIAETLLKQGDRVVVVDNLSSGKLENVQLLKGLGADFEFVEGDLRDERVAKKSVRGVEVIFHEAAQGSVPKSVEDPIGAHHANITATLNLLVAAKEEGVRRVVTAASSSAYGETPELPKKESHVPHPRSPYAVTKLAQEHYCHAFSVTYGLQTFSLRYFNVFGPRQDPDSQYAAVIPRFFRSCIKGEPILIYGDGEQTRDFTFISDVVKANVSAARTKEALGDVVNIAGGKAISINMLANEVISISGKKTNVVHEAARPGDIRHSLADISLAKEKIGFEPKVSLREGLEKSFQWYAKTL